MLGQSKSTYVITKIDLSFWDSPCPRLVHVWGFRKYKNFGFFWPSAKITAKNVQKGGFLSIFPNFTNDHSFYTDGLLGFIFSGVVRIVKKSIFCFLTFSKFGHQVALCSLFTFSFLLVLPMFRLVLPTFFFLRWTIYIIRTYFEKIGIVLFFVYK